MLGGPSESLLALGVEEQANSEEKMRFSLKDVETDVRSRDRTIKPYFHQPSHSSCFLVIELCFSRNRTNDRSLLSIQGYGASRKLHGEALCPE
jgi:hypothetical protein